jgi:hypothetical protein
MVLSFLANCWGYNSPMRSWLTIGTLAVVLLATPMWSQMRPSGRANVPVGRFGFAPRHSGFFPGGFGRRPGFFFHRNPFFFGQFGHRRRFFFGGSVFSSPLYYSSGYYPLDYGYSYPVVVQAPPQSSYYPQEYRQNGQLQHDIDVLTGKVDRLQEEVERRLPYTPRESRPQPEPAPLPSTVLVFKDRHTQEVRNYAIVGETVWVFDEQRADKIPVADIDLEATAKLNEERGVEFRPPQ